MPRNQRTNDLTRSRHTRLLDRMEKRGLITRERQKDDRRVIKTRITAEGLATLKKLDQPVPELHQTQFGRT